MSSLKIPEHNSPKNHPTGSCIGACLICGGYFMGPKRCRICAECIKQPQGDDNG